MKRHVLAALAVVALAAPLLGTAPAMAAPNAASTAPRADSAPGKPTITTVLPGLIAGSILLDWAAPQVDGVDDSSVTGYQVRYSVYQATPDWTTLDRTGTSVTAATVKNLQESKLYVFQVRAYNDAGDGAWSDSSDAQQPDQGVGKPTDVKGTPGEGLVNVTWSEPDPAAKSYQVQYKTDTPGAQWQGAAAFTTTQAFYQMTNLTPGVNYFFRVRSYNSDTDVSDWTESQTAVSPLATPGAPGNVRAVAGDSSAVVSWSAPTPAPDRYEVQYRTSANASPWNPTNPLSTTATSTNVTGLVNGTGYYFRVRAVRGSGSSTWVETTSPVTPVASTVTPAAPTSVTGIPQDSAVTLTWNMPAGQQVTTYEIQFSTNNSQWAPTPAISTYRTDQHYTVTGLNNGTAYYFRVRAMNGAVGSGWTQMSGSVVPVAVPGPPLNVVGTPGNNLVVLNWIAPPVVGSTSPVVGYRVQYSTNGGATWTSAPDVYNNVTTTTVTGLTNGTGYIFRVRAVSYAGDGAWSNPSSTVTPPGGPTAPTNVVAVAGNGQATVSWTASTSPASPIFGYTVTATSGGAFCTTSSVPPAAPATSCTVTGLTNGVTYAFTVKVLTQAGTSATSAPSNSVTPQGPSKSISITDSGRNGGKAYVTGSTTGITSGTTLTAMVKSKTGGKFVPSGQVAVQDDGTFSWSMSTNKRIWVKFTGGGVTSQVVTINR